MKKIFLLSYFAFSFSSLLSPFSFPFSFLLSPLSSLLSAQVPHSFSYQAVVRNSQGEPLSFQPVSFRISLLQESPGGTVSYQETHLQTTNFFGLVNLEIGNGKVVTGAMDTIRWDLHRYFINVEADISGNNNFVAMGTTQLLSVPYALYAEKAGGGRQEADLDWEVIGNDVVTGHGGSYPTGNVGIGNNAPGSLLYVAKNTGEPTITIRNMGGGGGASYSMVDDLSGASWKFKATTFGGFKIRDQANALDVFTIEPNSAANSLYIKTGGNIGIGTTLPAFKVDVLGNVNASGYYKGGIPFLPPGLQDLDGDTRIAVEENPDEDIIRFHTGGQEQVRIMDKRIEILNPDNNVFLGEQSGEMNSGGIDNVFIGHLAGKSNTTGSYNIIIGDSAGSASTTGANNTYVGAWSGTLNTTGICNAFFGTDAGERNQTGTRNAFLGYGAGYRSTGSRNTFVGSHAGMNNTAGDYNTFVGQAAGYNNSGNLNVFIGKSAGAGEGGSNKLYIANSDTSEPLIYGEFDNQLLRFHAKRIDVRNPLENTILGDNAGYGTSGSRNVYLGTRAVVYESSGTSNVMIGYEAGAHNTTGNWGVMVGYQAGSANTSGGYNVFLGWLTGFQNTSGHRNTFVGGNAGLSNTTGMRNTFIGLAAGQQNRTGSNSTYIGRGAGLNNTSGKFNVFLGDMAGANEKGSNKLYIANSETPEPLIYGDFAEKRMKIWADTLEVEGVTGTGIKFSVGGDPGISDTLFAITSFDFANQKIKFRRQVIKGGITIELTSESEWMDSISKQYVFCDPLTDARDGKQYQTVRISDQCWMAGNLNVGNMIEGTIEQSDNGTIEKYCYENSEENCNTYGGLYQWNEILQYGAGSQGICPKGWHIPTDVEYKILEGTVDSLYGVGNTVWDQTGWRGYNAGKNLKAQGWNGTDAFGFNALPAGYRTEDGSAFSGMSSHAYFWAFSSTGPDTGYVRHLDASSQLVHRFLASGDQGNSLRCIKGQGIESPSVETANLTSITGTTATGGGNITADGGDPVTARGVVWSTTENPTLANSFTTDGSGTGEFVSNLTGLTNATRYYVRAYAINSTGTRYGNQLAFTTPGASCPGGSTVDWQGKTYHTVMIGNQCWMKENLNVGSMIDITIEQSNNGTIEKYCYNNDTANCTQYGGFYLWNEMMQYDSQQGSQGICPGGWHVASDDEWKVLEGTVDSQYGVGDAVWEINGTRGSDAGLNLKSTSGWNDNGNGTDPYGFSGLPGGFCWPGGGFGYINQYSAYWTSTETQNTDKAWDRGLNSPNGQVDRMNDGKSDYGQAARCLNNQTSLPMVTTETVTGVTQTSATSGGNVTSIGGSAVTARGICWNTSGSPTVSDVHTTDGSGTGTFTSNMAGLSAHTQYYVRAYAINSLGTAYGSQKLFITQGESCPGIPTVTWGDQTYQTVQIGNQCWLEENLNIGTMIEGTMEQLNNGTIEKYCYDNDASNCDTYGGLYQWNEAMQYSTQEGSRGICPDGWHIPTDQELKTLEGTVDTHYGVGDPEWNKADCRGNDAGTHLKSFTGWPEWCIGDNLTGFNYLCSQGYRDINGTFMSAESGSPLWSSSQYNSNSSWPRAFPCHMGGLCRNYDDHRYGWSIRCIKD